MQEPERVGVLFADARELYDEAREQLTQGKLRNSAEKAWGATKRATDGLLLARTGREPSDDGQTTQGLRILMWDNPQIDRELKGRYNTRANVLHGMCFYDGNCEPEDVTERDIRETLDYIREAERLAGE